MSIILPHSISCCTYFPAAHNHYYFATLNLLPNIIMLVCVCDCIVACQLHISTCVAIYFPCFALPFCPFICPFKNKTWVIITHDAACSLTAACTPPLQHLGDAACSLTAACTPPLQHMGDNDRRSSCAIMTAAIMIAAIMTAARMTADHPDHRSSCATYTTR